MRNRTQLIREFVSCWAAPSQRAASSWTGITIWPSMSAQEPWLYTISSCFGCKSKPLKTLVVKRPSNNFTCFGCRLSFERSECLSWAADDSNEFKTQVVFALWSDSRPPRPGSYEVHPPVYGSQHPTPPECLTTKIRISLCSTRTFVELIFDNTLSRTKKGLRRPVVSKEDCKTSQARSPPNLSSKSLLCAVCSVHALFREPSASTNCG